MRNREIDNLRRKIKSREDFADVEFLEHVKHLTKLSSEDISSLAFMYETGQVFEKSLKRSVTLYKIVADNSSNYAMV